MNIDKTLFDFAAWIIGAVLRRAVSDPERRAAIIDKAKALVTEVGELLDAVAKG